MREKGRLHIRLSGFGGQGIILMGNILGRAITIYDHRFATLIQTYGPEARGSACRADLIVADEQVDYPHVERVDLLVAMSQDGYMKNRAALASGGVLVYESELVMPIEDEPARPEGFLGASASDTLTTASIPATRLAEEVGNRIIANMIMLGFVAGVTGVTSLRSLEWAVESAVPKGTEAINLAALRRGEEQARQTDAGVVVSAKVESSSFCVQPGLVILT